MPPPFKFPHPNLLSLLTFLCPIKAWSPVVIMPHPLYPSNSPLLPAPAPIPHLRYLHPLFLPGFPTMNVPNPSTLPTDPLLSAPPHLLTSSVLSRVPSLLLLSVVVTSEESSASTLGARIKLGRSLPFLQNPQNNIVS